jgi:hypothetical protein
LRYRNFIWISSHGIRSTGQRCARVNFYVANATNSALSNIEVGRRPETLGVRLGFSAPGAVIGGGT